MTGFAAFGYALLFCCSTGFQAARTESTAALPTFARNTVLVYTSSNESEAPFVVRLATFSPERYLEWEDATTQGTILLNAKSLVEATEYVNWKLYQAGVDTFGKNTTTLWLSRRIFRELKEQQKVKIVMDSMPTWLRLMGTDQMTVQVNREARPVPVIKTMDERGMERWFLDLEDNPLMVKLVSRGYQQKLDSITTNRPNTLRWIKDKKIR